MFARTLSVRVREHIQYIILSAEGAVRASEKVLCQGCTRFQVSAAAFYVSIPHVLLWGIPANIAIVMPSIKS